MPGGKKLKALSLIELLAAITISSIVIGVSTGVWLQSLNTYKYSKAQVRLQEEARYIIEYMSKELRMSSNFFAMPGQLSFRNSDGDSILYKHENNVLKRSNSQINADDVLVDNVEFTVEQNNPALITLKFTFKDQPKLAGGQGTNATLTVQTSVSSRIIQ